MSYAVINGEFVKHDEAKLHISDLGLRRGYAVFEFFRVLQGVPLFIDDHLARLARSASIADLTLPQGKDKLKALLQNLIEKNTLNDAAVQLVLTGGYSEDIFTPTKPNLIIAPLAIEALPTHYHTDGVKLITHKHVRELPEAKSTAYLTALKLAKQMKQQGAMEIVYYDDSRVYEASRSGLAFIKNGVFVTAKEGVLESVTMKHLLILARERMPVEERNYTLQELLDADEALMTGAVRGVLLVSRIGDRAIGNGKIGEHGQALRQAFNEHVATYISKQKLSQQIV